MAALTDSEKDVDSTWKKNNFSRSLSYSGGKKSASFKANHSSSLKGLEEFRDQNEARKNVFDDLCKHLGSLHNDPLSLRDWEQFEIWCINDEERLSNSKTSSEAAEVYNKCKLIMVDMYGQLPDEKIWKEAKEWYLALYPGSFQQEKAHNMPRSTIITFKSLKNSRMSSSQEGEYVTLREDKHHFKEIPTDTTEHHRKLKFLERQHCLECPTKRDDPKSRTRIEVDNLRQYTENEVDQLKKKIAKLEKLLEERENLELTRSLSNPYPEQRQHSSVGENQTFLEHMGQNLDKKLEALQMECEQLTRENMQKGQEINYLKSNEKKASDRVEELETECAQLHIAMKNQDIHTEREIRRSLEEYNQVLNDAQQKLLSKENQIQRLEEEKEDALRRLSTLASAKLSENNPDITDLSDMNRPQKIAEKYSELYDNEWTDSYEYLTSNGQDHKKAVANLLHMFESCFHYCKTLGRHQFDYLFATACSPSYDQKDKDLGATGDAVSMARPMITQKVVELRKVAFQQSLKDIRQAYQTDKGRHFVQSTTKEISLYMDKCLEISWLACIQDPPLEIVSDFPTFSKVDLNIVRKYTKSGEYVEYVIWPALLLSNDGALLSKGVVQCTSQSHPTPDQQM